MCTKKRTTNVQQSNLIDQRTREWYYKIKKQGKKDERTVYKSLFII